MANQQITQNAHAKVNLTLEALGRRDDGYHDVVSVIQTVDLHDTLTFEPADQLELVCDDPELAGCGNLAWRAARLMQDSARTADGARISIAKRIPVAAGLGGGSSDAAATLVALNRLWRLGLSIGELTALAARLGSDVPFLLRGGTAMVSGRGERVAPLPPADLEWLVIACPDIPVPNKTASLYGRLSPVNFTPRRAHAKAGGAHTRRGRRASAIPLQRVRRRGVRRFLGTARLLGRDARDGSAGGTPCRQRPVAVRPGVQQGGGRGTTAPSNPPARSGGAPRQDEGQLRGGRRVYELIAGATLGMLMASVFICTVALMLFFMMKSGSPAAQRIIENRSPTVVGLGAVALAYPTWAVVGGVCGVLYRISLEQVPGGGFGSPNLAFTMGVVVAALMLAAPLAVLLRRALAGVVVITLTAIGVFGWFLPYYAA